MRYVLALLAVFFLYCGAAQAQDALVVQSCGVLPQAYSAGATRQLTVDVNGNLCGAGLVNAPAAKTWAFFGDSIAVGSDTGNLSNGACTSATQFCQAVLSGSYGTWINLYTSYRGYRAPGFNCGQNGITVSQLVANISCVLNLAPDFVVMETGGNDAAGNVSCASFTATDRQIVNTFLNAGIAVFEVSVYPRSSPSTYTAAQANLAQCYNRARAQFARENAHRGYYYVDISSVAVDPTVTGSWASPSGFLTDGAHPTSAGGSSSGFLIAQQINALIPNWRAPLFSNGDVYDATNNPNGNLLPNGLLTGSGGSTGGGVTGTVASNSTITSGNLGGATVAASVSTGTDNRPIQTITLSGTYLGSSLKVFLFQDAATPSNGNIGDVLQGEACVNIGANTNIADVSVRLLTTESAVNYNMDAAQGTAAANPLPSTGWATGTYICQITPARTLTAVPTKIELQVNVDFINQGGSSAIAGTVQIQSAAVRKLTP